VFLRALAIEPERPITLVALARSSQYEHRYQEAVRWSDSALVIDPGLYQAYTQRARVRLQLGRSAEALSDAETAVRLAVGDRAHEEAVLALVEAQTGDSQAARARVERVLAGMRDPHWPPFGTAFLGAVLVALGEAARAIDFLERLGPRGARLWFQLRAPEFDPLRSDPRFERLIEESRPPGAPR
jgi:tetratricopeptide (TPR) repeat protein